MHLVKLVVLGATGTGKSSIIQQFLETTFTDQRTPTTLNPAENSYNFTIIMNGSVYQIKIIDMPMINYFPSNAFYEWTDFRGCALRSAHGYLLIFDLTSPGSFQYVKVIRDQLSESRNMQNIPVYVVGNKADLCTSVLNNMRSSHSHHSHHHRNYYHSLGSHTLGSAHHFFTSHHHSFSSHSHHHHSSSSHNHRHHHHTHHQHHHHHHWEDLTPAFKELANLVKKQWKCNYLECSAKYNWRIVPIFRDILRLIELNQMKSIDSVQSTSKERDHHDTLHRDSIKFSLTSATGYLSSSNAQTNNRTSTALDRTTTTSNDSNHNFCVIL